MLQLMYSFSLIYVVLSEFALCRDEAEMVLLHSEQMYYGEDTEKTLTDRASTELAKSNLAYCNVGRLDVFIGKDIKKHGTAEYLGGLTCVTAAHCVVKDKDNPAARFILSFILDDDRIETCEIEQIEIHTNYKMDSSYDVAVLRLKVPIVGLNGLSPCYRYGKVNRNLMNFPEVVFVGYCNAYTDVDYVCPDDGKRRACKSRLWKEQVKKIIGILSAPHRSNTNKKHYIVSDYFSYEPVVAISRPPTEYELGPKSGMSGGGVFEENTECDLSFDVEQARD